MQKQYLAMIIMGLMTNAVQAERPLRILIVNDDGCESIGTTSLHDKLTAKGYEVWMSAPATNQSGVGSAISNKPNKIFDVKVPADKRYCFPGTPADAVDFGLQGLLKENPPDLVISGVNDGPNEGIKQTNSGTIAAAVRSIRYGFPTIAASIGRAPVPNDEERKAGWPSTYKYWSDSVDYVVLLVDMLNKQWQPGQSILPERSGISINYPALPKDQVRGAHYVENQFHAPPQFEFKLLQDNKAQLIEVIPKPVTDNTDAGWLNKGYITLNLIDGDWNAQHFEAQYRKLIGTPVLPK